MEAGPSALQTSCCLHHQACTSTTCLVVLGPDADWENDDGGGRVILQNSALFGAALQTSRWTSVGEASA